MRINDFFIVGDYDTDEEYSFSHHMNNWLNADLIMKLFTSIWLHCSSIGVKKAQKKPAYLKTFFVCQF